MSQWPSTKARRVYRALLRIGWQESHRASNGSHQVLIKAGLPNFVWAFHDNVEIGPKMLARIARHTGLSPEDL